MMPHWDWHALTVTHYEKYISCIKMFLQQKYFLILSYFILGSVFLALYMYLWTSLYLSKKIEYNRSCTTVYILRMFFTVSDDQIPCLVYISFKSQTRAKNKKGQSIDIKCQSIGIKHLSFCLTCDKEKPKTDFT